MTKKNRRNKIILFASMILIQAFIGANITNQFVENSTFLNSTNYRTENPIAGAEYWINTDPILINSGNIEVFYDDILSGTITGNPFPLGTKIDFQFNNLTYFRSKIYNPNIFSIPILSTELYSEDIRDLPGITIDHSVSTVFTYYDDRTADIKYNDTTRSRSLQGVKKVTFMNAGESFLEYQNLDLQQFCEDESFEGIHIDLLIPNVYSIWSGATYIGMKVQFIEEIVGEDDKIWNSTYSGAEILDSFLETTVKYVFVDMWTHHISLDIGFKELEDSMAGFNISKINRIKITGVDNSIHPDFSFEDPTYRDQSLVCAGMYLVDVINNASIYYTDELNEDPNKYNFSIYVPEGGLIGDVAYASEPFYFKRQISNIGTDYQMEDRISRLTPLLINNIEFDGNNQSIDTDFINEKGYLLTAEYENGTRFQFGTPLTNELSDSQSFNINVDPGKYYNFFLEYSGNLFFNATKCFLKDQCELSIPVLQDYYINPSIPCLTDSFELIYVYDSIDGLPEDNPLTYWYINETYHPEYDNLIVIPVSENSYDDRWFAKITPYDGITYGKNYTTPTVTVSNAPPIIWDIYFYNSPIYENTNLSISFQYDDPDGEWSEVVISIKWYLNDTYMPEFDNLYNISSEYIIADDIWKVELFASDYYSDSEIYTSEITVLKNYLGVITYEGEYLYYDTWGTSIEDITITWKIIDETNQNPSIELYHNGYLASANLVGEYIHYDLNPRVGYHNFNLTYYDGLGKNVSCLTTIFVNWTNTLPIITYEKEITVQQSQSKFDVTWKIEDQMNKNPIFDIYINESWRKIDYWDGKDVKIAFDSKGIGEYNYTLIFNDGLGGIVSATTIINVIKDEDSIVPDDPESNSVDGFPFFTMSLFLIIGVIIIKKRLKSLKK